MNDKVLVRYCNRSKWTYYIGYIGVLSEGGTISYEIRFYKTYKKPLQFKLTKQIDRDTVLRCLLLRKFTCFRTLTILNSFFLLMKKIMYILHGSLIDPMIFIPIFFSSLKTY